MTGVVHVGRARARLTKDQILELYLNDVSLGQRGSFAIHGVAEAARLFFGKDITNVTLAEAATIAGVIQSPSRLLAVQQPGAREGAAQRRAARDGRRRLHQRGRAPSAPSREPLQIVGARARGRGAVLRRLHQPGAAGRSTTARRRGRRLHDARPAPAAPRAGRRARRARRASTRSSRGASASARRRR